MFSSLLFLPGVAVSWLCCFCHHLPLLHWMHQRTPGQFLSVCYWVEQFWLRRDCSVLKVRKKAAGQWRDDSRLVPNSDSGAEAGAGALTPTEEADTSSIYLPDQGHLQRESETSRHERIQPQAHTIYRDQPDNTNAPWSFAGLTSAWAE